ncbi:MAG: solute carrier organic anion transporter [Kiritimatiellales bacterium]|nr:solute carrier organic anion transporter [Kiritimatiellales bacterium]
MKSFIAFVSVVAVTVATATITSLSPSHQQGSLITDAGNLIGSMNFGRLQNSKDDDDKDDEDKDDDKDDEDKDAKYNLKDYSDKLTDVKDEIKDYLEDKGYKNSDRNRIAIAVIKELAIRIHFNIWKGTKKELMDETENILTELGYGEDNDPVCGNGTKEDGEDCEADNQCSSDELCNSNCKCEEVIPVCGDGNKQGNEECETSSDCSSDASCNACRCITNSTIVNPICGNNELEGDEECEPPSSNTCNGQCKLITNVTNHGSSDTDNGNGNNSDNENGNNDTENGDNSNNENGNNSNNSINNSTNNGNNSDNENGNNDTENGDNSNNENGNNSNNSVNNSTNNGNNSDNENENNDTKNGDNSNNDEDASDDEENDDKDTNNKDEYIPMCGNDILDEGEECEPPRTGVCDAQCRLLPMYGRIPEGCFRTSGSWTTDRNQCEKNQQQFYKQIKEIIFTEGMDSNQLSGIPKNILETIASMDIPIDIETAEDDKQLKKRMREEYVDKDQMQNTRNELLDAIKEARNRLTIIHGNVATLPAFGEQFITHSIGWLNAAQDYVGANEKSEDELKEVAKLVKQLVTNTDSLLAHLQETGVLPSSNEVEIENIVDRIGNVLDTLPSAFLILEEENVELDLNATLAYIEARIKFDNVRANCHDNKNGCSELWGVFEEIDAIQAFIDTALIQARRDDLKDKIDALFNS